MAGMSPSRVVSQSEGITSNTAERTTWLASPDELRSFVAPMNAPFTDELARRFHLLMNNPPAITAAEVAAVSATAAFLMLAPALFALGDARRRRAAMRAAQPPPYLPPLATDIPLFGTAESPGIWPSESAATPEYAEAAAEGDSEVVAGVPEIADVAGSEAATTAEVATVFEAAVPIVPPPPPEPVSADISASDTALSEPIAPPVVQRAPAAPVAPPTPVPPVAVAVETAVAPPRPIAAAATDRDPVAVGVLLQPQETAAGSQSFQLLDLRQARLADWPPNEMYADAEKSRLWHEGEKLAARFDARISKLELRASFRPEAAALARVHSDGQRFRLHFFLFADLWPSSSADAKARAVFEIDPAGESVQGWIEPAFQ